MRLRQCASGLVCVAVVATACGGESEVADSSPSSRGVSSTTAAPSSASSSVAAVPSTVTIDETSRYSSGSLVANCPATVSEGTGGDETLTMPAPSLFDPATGAFVKVPQPDVPAGTQLIRVGCLPSGTAESPTVTFRLSLRTPAQGLQPEKFEYQIATYSTDPEKAPVRATLDFPTTGETYTAMAGTGGNLLVDAGGERGRYRLMRTDGTEIASYPRYNSQIEYVDENVFVIRDSSDYGRALPGEFVAKVTMFDSATGAPASWGGVLSNQYNSSFGQTENGFIHSYGFSGEAYVDTSNKRRIELAPDGDKHTAAGIEITGGYAFVESRGFRVVDLASGRVVLSKTEEEWTGLGVERWYAANNYLYIENDDDSPVIDITTGQRVSSGWARRPTNRIGDKWTLVMQSPVTNNYAHCFSGRSHTGSPTGGMTALRDGFGCYGQGTLVHSPQGFPGPWF